MPDMSEALDNSSPTDHEPDDLLADEGELDGQASDAADPIHLARCAECAEAVRYRSNVTGSGFFLVDADPDAVFGVGENGRPICRNGHGEMSIADDKLPAAEAFALAQERLDGPVQRELPGVFPAFNWAGAGQDMAGQAVKVEALKKVYDDAADKAKKAKKAWDDAEELLTTMGVEYARRAKAKADGTDDTPTAVVAGCAWTSKHPGQPCPICSNIVVAAVVERIIGINVAPSDAATHADHVDALLLGMEINACDDALEAIDTFIDRDVIAEWSAEEREAVTAYAKVQRAALEGNLDTPTATVTVERPAVLGKPHIPAPCVEGEHQVCQFCEVVILPASADRVPYKGTDYVGVNCKGKPDAGHRYPSNKGKKTAAKKIAPQPKPSAKAKGAKKGKR